MYSGRCIRYILISICIAYYLAHRALATDCYDGGDRSVEFCCYDLNGICLTRCDIGYGLLLNDTKCGKCKDPKCGECNDNVNKCNRYYINIENCAIKDHPDTCFDCELGYRLSNDRKRCIKCPIRNCDVCNSTSCQECSVGYGLVQEKCQKCSQDTCARCDGNVSKCPRHECQSTKYDKDGNYRFYGSKDGICTMCPVGVFSCFDDGFSCQSGYKLVGSDTCKKLTSSSSSAFAADALNTTTGPSPPSSSSLIITIMSWLAILLSHMA
mmetsp:Transcript_4352/g.8653  ORF Transcript_4352/g.8653 Transcript_4352/m.8653 type:complete len:268 (+) Transcript_4352:121-924(+)|eukprot:CAMPEP_0118803848 /NCGR_PEP_ID=MMETSP1161-20130426/19680_1 /TAXON_ID=249345 /ORGANISM="Picochlorum oklahomensis, Strain CCMP2329" /LENGTH=267 /DNA_ID=CAMNT_0006732447 /DNA_START=93 /DNA_END=896 /DNA_ORIENTATION=-